MNATPSAPATVDAYVASFPADVRVLLEQVRRTIRETAPDAEESISYQIAAYKLKGRVLVYFAGHKKHVGLYPIPIGNPELPELAEYASGKGTAQFPLNKPLPLDLIRKLVQFRAKDCRERDEAKRKKK